MKKFISHAVLTTVFLTMVFPLTALAASFSDVPQTHPQYTAIESLKNLKVIKGYEDNTFRPNKPVTRSEALKMIMVAAGISADGEAGDIKFKDVPSDQWYARFVKHAVKNKIVQGNPDSTFKPLRNVKKSEFVKMLLVSFKQDVSKHKNLPKPVATDVPAGQWFAPYFSFAKTIGIIYTDLGNKLYPGKDLTRAECAEIIYKMLIVNKGGDIQKMLSITEAKLVDVLVKLNNNDIKSAVDSANSAVFFSQKALEIDGEKGIVKAANKIAIGFQRLTQAYEAGLAGDKEKVKALVAEAKDLAGQAFNHDNSTQPLGKKIKQQGDVLLQQVQ